MVVSNCLCWGHLGSPMGTFWWLWACGSLLLRSFIHHIPPVPVAFPVKPLTLTPAVMAREWDTQPPGLGDAPAVSSITSAAAGAGAARLAQRQASCN